MAARRNHKRRDWPRGLYEPRPGYYTWRSPQGEVLPLGRIPLAEAKAQAAAANLHVMGSAPTLIERITQGTHTVAEVLEKMPAGGAVNTVKSRRSQDKAIRESLGAVLCQELTTQQCAEFLEGVEAEGKQRWAQALRSRLIAVCDRAMQLGWNDRNPADATRAPRVAVKRGRLTLDTYRRILARAADVAEWLPKAMQLALCTGADRSTIVGMRSAMIDGEQLVIRRSKTGITLALPLHLELVEAGLLLRDLAVPLVPSKSDLFVCHVKSYKSAPPGGPIHPDRVSHAFAEARQLAGIPDDGAPTFHELRSLAKRLYAAQGNVDTRWLLGHADESTATRYANPRGAEAVQVRVDPLPSNARQVNNK